MELISPAKIMLEFGDTLCPFLKVNWHWISNKGLPKNKPKPKIAPVLNVLIVPALSKTPDYLKINILQNYS